MVAAFLLGEIRSPRFGESMLTMLRRHGRDRDVVDRPDITNEAENAYRSRLLGELRGYRRNHALFEGFPDDVVWQRYELTRDDFAHIRTINYSYWNELSGGSRLPADAARRVRAGVTVCGQSNQAIEDAARALAAGVRFPELILVSTAPGAQMVVLEGHVRLTAYHLMPSCIPEASTALLGISPQLARWMALCSPD